MKSEKPFSIFIFLIIILAGCNNDLTIDDYSSTVVKFAKRRHVSEKLAYEMTLPLNWKVKEVDSNDMYQSETMIDTTNHSNVFSFISIVKYKGNTASLKKEFEQSSKNNLLPSPLKIMSEGKTILLRQPAFYRHVRSTGGHKNEAEMISFLVSSKDPKVFYSITAAIPQNQDAKAEMGMLLYCVRTFKLK